MLYLRFFTIIINVLFFRKIFIKYNRENSSLSPICSDKFMVFPNEKKSKINIKPNCNDGYDMRNNTMNLSKRSGDKELFTGERSSELNTVNKKYSIARNFYKKNLLDNLKNYNISLNDKINMIRSNYIELYKIKDLNNEL